MPTRPMRPILLHFALVQSAVSLAGGFIGAYFLKSGFSLAFALAAYAGYLGIRFVLRFAALELIRRIGYRSGMMAGTAIMGLQFIPLMHADRPLWLLGWMLCIALGESLYCPLWHAAMATSATADQRGRQVGMQTAIGTLINIAAPLAGAWVLTAVGTDANFALATALTLLAVLPLFALGPIEAGPVPAARHSLANLDRTAMLAFAADGWLSAGLMFAWPMILFTALGSRYAALGITTAAAGLVAALAGMLCGRFIDGGHRNHLLNLACLLLTASFLMRAAASWSPWAAIAANLTGAAVMALYIPVLMSTIYERARRSGAVFRFHFAAEAGWDAGAVSGCLATALVATLCPSIPSLAMLPAMAGIALMRACIRADLRLTRAAPEVVV